MAPPPSDAPGKDPGAFRTIREVSEQLGVPQHVLRFWETRFPELKPLQRGGNRRYYRPGDVAFAAALHKLLHQDGYTVKGVRKLITEHGAGNLVAIANGGSAPARAARPTEPQPQPAPEPSAPAPAPAWEVPAQPQATPADGALLAELQLLRDRLAAALAA
jgi:DNA-binding transcriptional MerR regulator